jgi:nucleotide-binding universal stress UspA family protein
MFEKIIVPLDASIASEVVFPYVAEIASRFGSRITLTRVCQSYDANFINKSRAYLKIAVDTLNGQLREWQSRTETEVTSEIKVGSPAVEIINYANQTLCDLIAITSRGESGDKPWPLGNVSAKILRSSNFPVLLIRKLPDGDAIKQRKLIKRILVPLDGSSLGEAAIPLASSLAANLSAEIVLLHVVQPMRYLLDSDAFGSSLNQNQIEEIEKHSAEEYLSQIKKSLMEKGYGISTFTASGFAADEIIDYAKSNNIDLIAIATHGRSGFGRWVFGSVTDKVLHAGDTPVLVVRSKPVLKTM